jgi:hypothetical protein
VGYVAVYDYHIDIDVLAAIGLMPGGSVYIQIYTQQVQHIKK